MDITDNIEKSLQTASSVQFFISRHSKEPAVVALVFDTAYDGAEGYKLLVEHYKNRKATLVLFKTEAEIDISIVAKDSAEAVNIHHLKYDEAQLKNFLSNEPKGSGYVFVIGYLQENKLVLVALSEQVPIVVLDKYELVNRPI